MSYMYMCVALATLFSHCTGYAFDPSADTAVDVTLPIVGDLQAAEDGKG